MKNPPLLKYLTGWHRDKYNNLSTIKQILDIGLLGPDSLQTTGGQHAG